MKLHQSYAFHQGAWSDLGQDLLKLWPDDAKHTDEQLAQEMVKRGYNKFPGTVPDEVDVDEAYAVIWTADPQAAADSVGAKYSFAIEMQMQYGELYGWIFCTDLPSYLQFRALLLQTYQK